jgi:hypothetical protein
MSEPATRISSLNTFTGIREVSLDVEQVELLHTSPQSAAFVYSASAPRQHLIDCPAAVPTDYLMARMLGDIALQSFGKAGRDGSRP